MRVITAQGQPVPGILVQFQPQPAGGKPLLQTGKLNLHNRRHIPLAEPAEQQCRIQPVEKLRPEHGLHRRHHLGASLGAIGTIRQRQQMLSADVGCQQNQRIAEINPSALAICQMPFIQHLQQHIEDIGMRLLYLIEQDDLIGPPPHRLGQAAAILIPDIAGRGADQPRDRMFFHIFRHIEADHGAVLIEQERRQCLGQFGLADPGRAQHQERADGLVRISDAGARPAGGIGHRLQRFILADNPASQHLFHGQQFLTLTLQHLVYRDTCPAADHLGDMLGVDCLIDKIGFSQAGFCRFQFLGKPWQHRIREFGSFFQLTTALGDLQIVASLLYRFLQPLDFGHLCLGRFPGLALFG